MVLLCCVSTNAYDFAVNGIYYKIVGNEACVTYKGRTPTEYVSYYGNIVIPSSVFGNNRSYKVTSIGQGAFEGCTALTSITIPESIKEIDAYAFRHSGLKSITIPNSVRTIEYCTFYGCNSLENVVIPESVRYIEESAFGYCRNLTSVIIPNDGLNSAGIYENAFAGCTNLTTIFYTGIYPSSLWLATNTYVPHKERYSKASVIGGEGNIIEYVTFHNTTFTYGETPKITYTNNLEEIGYTASATIPELPQSAGTHTVVIPFTFSKDECNINIETLYTYTINKAPLIAKVKTMTRTYGESNPEFTISYSGFVNGENESVLTNKGTATTSATLKSDVGEYSITISDVTADNYEVQYETGSLFVNKAPLTVIADNATKIYGDNNPEFTLIYSGLKNDESSPEMITAFNIVTEASATSNVGKYDIAVNGGEAKNYEIMNYINGKLTVKKAPLTVTAKNFTKIYGDANPEFKFTYNGAKNNDNESAIFETLPTLSCFANETSNTGEYNIKISGALSNNYEISYKSGILSVIKRELTVSTKNYTRIYGEENPNFEISYNGFANNEDESALLLKPKAKTIAKKDSDVGVYDIKIEGGDDDNYSFAYNSGTLTIEKAEQTITWEQEFYDLEIGSQIELTAKASSGLGIEYIIPENDFVYIYTIDGTTYLDCYGTGDVVIRAIQNGNKNYNAATKVSKVINIVTTNINSVSADATVIKNGFCITLANANNRSVTIYSTNGTLIEKIDKYSGENIVLDKGVYIVQIESKIIKVKI